MLLAGVPVLLVPEHIEQLLLGRNVAALAAGAALNVQALGSRSAMMLACVIHDARYVEYASALAAKYERLEQTKQLRDMIGRLEAILASGANSRRGETRNLLFNNLRA
jgi:UDP:flavonoid glycosyltransferase YjiC (YdhE family)